LPGEIEALEARYLVLHPLLRPGRLPGLVIQHVGLAGPTDRAFNPGMAGELVRRGEAERAIASGYFDIFPEGTTP
jgi:hypothetical protein